MITIRDSFQDFLSDLSPSNGATAAAERHIASIRARLETSFDLSKTMLLGSYARDTFLEGCSDVDMLAVIRRGNVRWGETYPSSTSVLIRVRKALKDRYQSSHIRRDGQAVVVRFTDSPVDVVPAVFARWGDDGHPVYAMPDGEGDWMETCPSLHNQYLLEADESAGGKLRGTARLLKFWRHCREPQIPLSSFYIELVLAVDELCPVGTTYARCVASAFAALARRGCRPIRDPMQVSGLIPGVRTEVQRRVALDAVRYASEHAQAALEARRNNDIKEARRQWNLVFNGAFPR